MTHEYRLHVVVTSGERVVNSYYVSIESEKHLETQVEYHRELAGWFEERYSNPDMPKVGEALTYTIERRQIGPWEETTLEEALG